MATYLNISSFVLVFSALFLASCRKTAGQIPVPQFSYTETLTGQACLVQFTNQSIGLESSHWFFGDGTSSVERNPRHSYPAGVWYQVTLAAVGREHEASTTQMIYFSGN